MFNFKGKTVLITGTAQGCGRGIAQAFAEQGANVVMCDVNDEGGKETLALVEAARAKGFYQHADVSKEEDIKAFIDATVVRFGQLDIAITMLAIGLKGLMTGLAQSLA